MKPALLSATYIFLIILSIVILYSYVLHRPIYYVFASLFSGGSVTKVVYRSKEDYRNGQRIGKVCCRISLRAQTKISFSHGLFKYSNVAGVNITTRAE